MLDRDILGRLEGIGREHQIAVFDYMLGISETQPLTNRKDRGSFVRMNMRWPRKNKPPARTGGRNNLR
jgi:hypothetical protein